jgi:hypothetical protein
VDVCGLHRSILRWQMLRHIIARRRPPSEMPDYRKLGKGAGKSILTVPFNRFAAQGKKDSPIHGLVREAERFALPHI